MDKVDKLQIQLLVQESEIKKLKAKVQALQMQLNLVTFSAFTTTDSPH
jgi:hypothetical protein